MVLTPMLEQYRELKSRYPDCLLFFRLGDFYELFFADAETASRELEIALTSRAGAPMCGVPAEAVDAYLGRLVDRGYRIAICEQVEKPSPSRKLVRREVVRVVTPGTYLDPRLVGQKGSTALAAVRREEGSYLLALADVTTGESQTRAVEGEEELWAELAKAGVREVLLLPEEEELRRKALAAGLTVSPYPDPVPPAEALERYLRWTGVKAELRTKGKKAITLSLTPAAVRALELVSRADPGGMGPRGEGTLYHTLDFTLTAMGGRKLRRWILEPLAEKEAIEKRLSAVEELLSREELRRRLRERLQKVHDIERLLTRILGGVGSPRELWLLGSSLAALEELSRFARELESPLLRDIAGSIDGIPALHREIERALLPPSSSEGGIVRPGYHPVIDSLRERLSGDRSWIRKLEARERERTGIKSLKIGYNRVFGYYIEVTNPNRHLVPPHYERKQTMTGAERYVIPELKEREKAIAASEEELTRLEEEVVEELKRRVEEREEEIREQANRVAELDALSSLAEAARRYGYTRPVIEESRVLEMREGRHPVLERALGPGEYVPNDVYMDESRHLLLLTGPNMAGKSSLARQVALMVVMAQMGSFVPAGYFRLGIVDRIFTRIGSADDLWGGRSTFMVEMAEVAEILRSATSRSLVLLDEVGRGTGTADGLSIAWAVAEYLHDRVQARTIFATHFHELTALEQFLPRLQNLTMAVAERNGRVQFLYRIRPGKSSRSFGLYVAALAGLPEEVLSRASELAREWEQEGSRRLRPPRKLPDQLPLLTPWAG